MKPALHVLMAILAVWRITDLFTASERITVTLRKAVITRFPRVGYMFGCPRCFSVWAGMFCAAAFALYPWANWPFALSWLYIWHNEQVYSHRVAQRGREFRINVTESGNFTVNNELNPRELAQVMAKVNPTAIPAGYINGGTTGN